MNGSEMTQVPEPVPDGIVRIVCACDVVGYGPAAMLEEAAAYLMFRCPTCARASEN